MSSTSGHQSRGASRASALALDAGVDKKEIIGSLLLDLSVFDFSPNRKTLERILGKLTQQDLTELRDQINEALNEKYEAGLGDGHDDYEYGCK